MNKTIFLMILAVLLVACVTTEKGAYSKKSSKEQEVESRVRVAIALLEDNKPEAAMNNLKQALEINPKSARVHEILALTLERLGDVEKVMDHFELMLKYDSAYTRGRANYGSYLIRVENYQESYKQLSIVVQDVYYPNRVVAYAQLAKCADNLGKKSEVIVLYQKALSIDSTFAPALLELAHINYTSEDFPKAQEYLDSYRDNAKPPEARALLLGIKLSRKFQDKDGEGSFVIALKNLYPKSKEYLEYLDISR